MSCEACRNDPALKALSGCEDPSQEAVWEQDGDQFMSCPINFVPPTVSDWYEEYAYAKEFGSTVPFEQRPARWLDAMRIYNGAYNAYVDEKLAKSKAKMPTMRGSANG